MKRQRHVVVVEVDTQAIPAAEEYRLAHGRPVLWIGCTGKNRDQYVQELVDGEAGPRSLRVPGALSPRRDLYECYAAFTADSWERRRPALLRRLYAAGHGVHRRQQYRVYVGELERTAPGRRRLYVGQTSKRVAARWLEHRNGARTEGGRRLASRVVEQHGGQLLPELYEHLAVLPTKSGSLEQERQVAHALSLAGYDVEGDGIRTAPEGDDHVRDTAKHQELMKEHVRVNSLPPRIVKPQEDKERDE